jgi:hypothetical protein
MRSARNRQCVTLSRHSNRRLEPDHGSHGITSQADDDGSIYCLRGVVLVAQRLDKLDVVCGDAIVPRHPGEHGRVAAPTAMSARAIIRRR